MKSPEIDDELRKNIHDAINESAIDPRRFVPGRLLLALERCEAELTRIRVVVIDHAANSTRYLCVAALLPPGIASGDKPCWCVSFPLLTGTSYLVSEGAILHSGYVAQKWKAPAGDALEMARAIAKAVPNVRAA